ncbi:MAG: hypothetical protein ACI9PX_001073, partial [Reinekea sp.]
MTALGLFTLIRNWTVFMKKTLLCVSVMMAGSAFATPF